jgi:hypothetical protein
MATSAAFIGLSPLSIGNGNSTHSCLLVMVMRTCTHFLSTVSFICAIRRYINMSQLILLVFLHKLILLVKERFLSKKKVKERFNLFFDMILHIQILKVLEVHFIFILDRYKRWSSPKERTLNNNNFSGSDPHIIS